MRCGVRAAHPAHDDIQRLGHYCVGVSADDAVVYAIMGAAEELVRRWHLSGLDDEKLPETARIEMHPAILNAFYRQDIYPMTPKSIGDSRAELSSLLTIPVVVVKGEYSKPHEWRLIIASGELDGSEDPG